MTAQAAAVKTVDEQLSWGQRISDRFNPILVREVQQALKGKLFLISLALASGAIVIGALVATVNGQGQGRDVFNLGLTLLMPIIMFVVPLQAFLSMRQEMQRGIADQLLLSRLRPGAIVMGKIQASVVQYALFMAVFAPLLALSFLLRGVDVPTITVCIAFTFVFNLLATSYCIAAGTFSRYKAVQPLTFVVAVAGPAFLTMMLMGLSWQVVREISRSMSDPEFWMGMTALAGGSLFATALFGMVASSLLAHDFENRSSPFRIFAGVFTAVTFLWVCLAVPVGYLDEAGPSVALTLIVSSIFLWLYSVTEESKLSPRVRTLVPRNQVLALLAVPFLPGGARGYMFTLALLAICLTAGAAIPLLGTGSIEEEVMYAAVAVACYTAFYAGLGRLMRGRLADGPVRSYAARMAVLVALFAGSLLPLLLEVLFTGDVDDWSAIHILNPAWTTFEMVDRNQWELMAPVALLAGVGILANLPAMLRGTFEVTEASAQRRRGAA